MAAQASRRRPLRTAAPYRRGLTKCDVLVVLVILVMIAAFAFPQLKKARDDEWACACRERLAVLGRALASYGNRNGGRLPGYMNLLRIEKGVPYVDPVTKEPKPGRVGPWESCPIWNEPTSTPTGRGHPVHQRRRPFTDVYLESLVCPADSSARTTGAFLSYVANTGMPDLPSVIPAKAADAENHASKGMPRHCKANGLFFDNFSDDPLVRQDSQMRGPMVYMRMELVRDPKERTILLTENMDATSYRLVPGSDKANRFSHAEAVVGATYAIGSVTGDSNETLAMTPARLSLKINADVSRGDGRNMGYCRPSSNHPGGVNVVYADQNAQFLNEKISYHETADDVVGRLPDEISWTAERVSQNYRGFGPIEIELNP